MATHSFGLREIKRGGKPRRKLFRQTNIRAVEAADTIGESRKACLSWRALVVTLLRGIADEIEQLPEDLNELKAMPNWLIECAKIQTIAAFFAAIADVYNVEDGLNLSVKISDEAPELIQDLTIACLEEYNIPATKGIQRSLVQNTFCARFCSTLLRKLFK